MKSFEELNWIPLGWCKSFPLSDGVRRYWKKQVTKSDIERFVDEVIDSSAIFFGVEYVEFSEVFDKKNPEIFAKINSLFEEKTGFLKGRLRIDFNDEDLDKMLMAIMVPDINRVDVTFDLFQRLSEREKVQFFWYMSKDIEIDSEEKLTSELLNVYNKYRSLYDSEQVAFLMKHVKQGNSI